MDGATFDRLAKDLTRRYSRRSALSAMTAGVVASIAGISTVDAARSLPKSCRNFAISGSRNIGKSFIYDDDMQITLFRQNGGRDTLLRDNDGMIGVDNASVAPIEFAARPGDRLRIVARDRTARCYSMEDLYLHCCKNPRCNSSRAAVRLTAGVKRKCVSAGSWKTRVFFNELFKI